jgi:lipopolysaccharide export LptBFGC system permease protein LptF
MGAALSSGNDEMRKRRKRFVSLFITYFVFWFLFYLGMGLSRAKA